MPNILFLNLNAFSQTGGIEKVSRVLAKAGYDIAKEGGSHFMNLSLHDGEADINYFPSSHYKGFSGNKAAFVIESVFLGRKADIILISHVNLAIPAILAKLLNPRVKIILIAHGIEIWRELSALKKLFLHKCSKIIAVSAYTKQRIVKRFPLLSSKTLVLNNCLDPFFQVPELKDKPQYLKARYKIADDEKVILTLCRLSSSEQYKGYDQVIEALAKLADNISFKYLLMGKYDDIEQERVEKLIEKTGLKGRVILTNFVADSEVTDHFLLGDVFIMPSTDEGFGIVFIEAGACGLPLIAGNKDGSSDALLNGKLGHLIDPFDRDEISDALKKTLTNPPEVDGRQALVIQSFSYEQYKDKLKNHLTF